MSQRQSCCVVDYLLEGSGGVRPFKAEDQPGIDQVIAVVFKDLLSPSRLDFYAHDHDPKLTLVYEREGRIVGCYLLKENSVLSAVEEGAKPLEDLEKYRNLRGIEGVALAILPEYQYNIGAAIELLSRPTEMGFDYMWGAQNAKLGNLLKWTKLSRLVAVCEGPPKWTVTLRDL